MNDLRRFTMARVALGRTGNGVPLRETLEFQLAHARARDAVHFPFDSRALASELGGVVFRSAARDRSEYLRRPDLGRRLSPESRVEAQRLRGEFDAAFVLADGLSALAVHRNAPGVLRELLPRLAGWRLAPVATVEQGRVAIGDEIGELLGASLVVILIGERPGLSSPDSLGAYLTWSPHPGRTDAERNCVSNIRPAGLSPGAAAELLAMLMASARAMRLSGLGLRIGGNRLPAEP